MTDDHESRAEEIFQDALDRPAAERAAYVAAACGDDAALRRDVESLLSHFQAAGTGYLRPERAESTDPPAPERIGPYRVVRLLGRGGMGRVWLAEQEEPLTRRVAVKVVAALGDDARGVRRFLEERQFLARLSHPNVAQVLDAGTDEAGTPHIVMEYVDGEPITRDADAHDASIEDRLRLFLAVCAGVEHAHERGVLHRDLKPSNVLVARPPGSDHPIPKVIDFGIAKELHESAVTRTLRGELVGTPEYMSPEQIAGGDVGTRSDVYSLGLLLYELLTGALPFADRAGDTPVVEYLRRASTDEIPRPSTRPSQLGDRTAEVARTRRLEPAALARRLRDDLDWIVLKAVARDPQDRYGSASELADDVRRHLEREPILARPPSRLYVARRWAARNPGLAVAAIAAAGGLIVVTGLSAFHSSRLERERAAAEREATVARTTRDFLVELFEAADPDAEPGEHVTAVDLLARGRERIADLPDDPATRAALLTSMGRVHAALSRLDDADSLLTSAIDDAGRPGVPIETGVDARAALASVRLNQGRPEEAETLLRTAIGMLPDGPEQADSHARLAIRLAEARQSLGHADEAEDALLDVAGREDVAPSLRLEAQESLAVLYLAVGRLPEADSIATRNYEALVERLGPDHGETLKALTTRAHVKRVLGDGEESLALWEEARDRIQRVRGPDDALTLQAQSGYLNSLGQVVGFDDPRLVPGFRDLLERSLRTTGDRSLASHASAVNLSFCLEKAGRAAEGVILLRETLARERDVLGPDAPNTLQTQCYLASTLGVLEKHAEATALLQDAVERQTRTLGPDHTQVSYSLFELGGLYSKQERWKEAADALSRCYDARVAAEGATPRTAWILRSLLHALLADGRRAEARERLRDAVARQTPEDDLRSDPALAELFEEISAPPTDG